MLPLPWLLREYQKLHARFVGLSRNADRGRHREKLSKSAHFKASFRFVRGVVSAPLLALARVAVGPLARPVVLSQLILVEPYLAKSLTGETHNINQAPKGTETKIHTTKKGNREPTSECQKHELNHPLFSAFANPLQQSYPEK